jgi:DNA-binding HxlR family transcriptional regulator
VKRHDRNPVCAVNVAIEVVGDSWSMLVVRDIVFYGKHTFGEFMAAAEQITTSVLADRLGRLVRAGILTKQRSSRDRRQERYELTEKGLDLIPILVELGNWGARYGPDVRAHPSWQHAAAADPGALHTLIRDTVAGGGAAFAGPNRALARLDEQAPAAGQRQARGVHPPHSTCRRLG